MFLSVVMRKTLPFKKSLYLTKMDRKMEGDTITRINIAIKTKTKTFDFKTTWVQVRESSIIQVQYQMVNTSFTIQKKIPAISNSELVPLIKIATLEHAHPIIRKFFTNSISNVQLAGILPYFITAREKMTRDQEMLSIVTGVRNPIISWENTKLE